MLCRKRNDTLSASTISVCGKENGSTRKCMCYSKNTLARKHPPTSPGQKKRRSTYAQEFYLRREDREKILCEIESQVYGRGIKIPPWELRKYFYSRRGRFAKRLKREIEYKKKIDEQKAN